MATIGPNGDNVPQRQEDSMQYAVSAVVVSSIVILALIILIKCCYLKRLSNKNLQSARRIRTISETMENRPPRYIDIPCRYTTSPDGSIQICVPESPPYVKDPPPYTK